MTTFLAGIDGLLRAETQPARAGRAQLHRVLMVALICGPGYGVIMGTFTGLSGGHTL